MQRFTRIEARQRARALVVATYRLTQSFPPDERFGLTQQLRRAVVSIAANIAEGSKRQTHRDFAHYLNMAEGSAGETESLLILARDLGFASADAVTPLIAEVSAISGMLFRLRQRIERQPAERAKPPP